MRILGIDYGDARIGLALSDASATLCGRAWTLTEWNLDRAVDAIADVVRAEGVERIVLGLPKNMDGTEGPRAEKSRMVAQRLITPRRFTQRRCIASLHARGIARRQLAAMRLRSKTAHIRCTPL